MAPASTTYLEAVGRRKTATARVRLVEAKQHSFTINGKAIEDYFQTATLRNSVAHVITKRNLTKDFAVSIKVIGGGVVSQAGAISLGIARALLKHDESLRTDLKHTGLLKRDPRMKERRKFGLKKARKAKQWSKR